MSQNTDAFDHVHPPDDVDDVLTKFPEAGIMALHDEDEDDPFIEGKYVNLEKFR